LTEHGLTSPPTQYRLYGNGFYRSEDGEDPTNSIKVLKEHTDYTIDRKNNKHTNTKHSKSPSLQ